VDDHAVVSPDSKLSKKTPRAVLFCLPGSAQGLVELEQPLGGRPAPRIVVASVSDHHLVALQQPVFSLLIATGFADAHTN